jgi:CheY-like chemotaxis protein
MRKRRAIIYDDEPIVLLVLKDFFEMRGYDVLACQEPVVCPLYGNGAGCASRLPCGDIMLTDYRMPGMNGIDLIRSQDRSGCKIIRSNKALLSGFLSDDKLSDVRELGVAFFEKPVDFTDLGRWVDKCETRMDLSLPLGQKRKEARELCGHMTTCTICDSRSVICRGTTINESRSGFCIRVPVALVKEQQVTLRGSLPDLAPLAQVRWVAETGDGDYLAGLQSIDAR